MDLTLFDAAADLIERDGFYSGKDPLDEERRVVTHCVSLGLVRAYQARTGDSGFAPTYDEHEHLAQALGWRGEERDGDLLKFIYAHNDQHSGKEGETWAVDLLRRLARGESGG